MKVRVPKSYKSLSQHDKDIISQVMDEEIEDRVNRHFAELQKIWLKFACIVLHRFFGFGKKRCLLFLANWREIYRYNSKLKDRDEQTAYLTAEMDSIFRKDGYPTEYVDKLEEF